MTYRVWMHSPAGIWQHYDGHVDVHAEDEADAVARAREKLKSGAFPDRPRGSWIIDRVECRGAD